MLSYKPEINNLNKGGRNLEKMEGRIEFKNINFHYPQRLHQVLCDFNLKIEAGRSIGLVGANGSGKSTLISLLERFYHPYAGSIEIDGNDIKELSLHDIRSQMALVSQEPILFDRSIRENILYGLDPSKYTEEDLLKAVRMANIEETIMGMPDGFETRVGNKGVQLSGGQK
jgi:ATP-binding cassette subfamily B (MDR/TAP) protein 1